MSKVSIYGRNIYQDDLNRPVLLDKKTSIGYVIQEKDKKQYNLYNQRFIIGLVLLILAINLKINIYLSLGFTILFLILLEYRYRKKFLPSLLQIKNFKPKDKLNKVDAIVANKEKSKSLLLGILYIILGILLGINLINKSYDYIILGSNIIIIIVALYFGITHLIAYSKMK